MKNERYIRPTSFTLDASTETMLLELCDGYGVKRSDVVRRLIKKAHEKWEIPGLEKLPRNTK